MEFIKIQLCKWIGYYQKMNLGAVVYCLCFVTVLKLGWYWFLLEPLRSKSRIEGARDWGSYKIFWNIIVCHFFQKKINPWKFVLFFLFYQEYWGCLSYQNFWGYYLKNRGPTSKTNNYLFILFTLAFFLFSRSLHQFQLPFPMPIRHLQSKD